MTGHPIRNEKSSTDNQYEHVLQGSIYLYMTINSQFFVLEHKRRQKKRHMSIFLLLIRKFQLKMIYTCLN